MSGGGDALDGMIDARAPGLAAADFIFVFGTRLPRPAELAAELFHQGMAPFIVVTGSGERQPNGLVEADHHRDLLLAAGVPAGCIVVENRSAHTLDNVLLALPLIHARKPEPRSAIAVVKRHHRRALVTLMRHMPSVDRVYAAAYDAELTAERRGKEMRHMRELIDAGVDPLDSRDGRGWSRSSPGARR